MFGFGKKDAPRTISDNYRDLDEYASGCVRRGGMARSEAADRRKWSRLSLSLVWEARGYLEDALAALDDGDTRSVSAYAGKAYRCLVKAYQASGRCPSIESAARRAEDACRATLSTVSVSHLESYVRLAIDGIDRSEHWLSNGGMFPSARPYVYGSADYAGYRG